MKQIILAGFHAVNARIRTRPGTVKVVYVDPARRDRRMQECRSRIMEAGVKIAGADPSRLDGMAPGLPHQGIVAIADEIEASLNFEQLLDSICPDTLVLVLDSVTDPRNFGACLRVADCAGVSAVIVARDRSARMSPAAARAAAGASETVPVVTVTNLAGAISDLADAGVEVIGTAGEAERTIYSWNQKRAFAWVLGAEGTGLRQLTRRRCTGLARIPMQGSVESLNVSVAAGICLFETVRQRQAMTVSD